MNDILIHRPPRSGPIRPTPSPVRLADPPASRGGGPPTPWTYALFPLLGSAGMLGFALVNRNPVYFLAGGVFVLGALGMGVMMILATRGRSKEQGTDARLRYLAHLAEVRTALRAAADDQRRMAEETHPDPPVLAGVPDRAGKLWERRPEDPDFLRLRLGRGRVPGIAAPELPDADPTSPRDPGTEAAARRLVERLGPVPDVPVAVPVRSGVAVVGDPARGRELARAMLAQLVTLHAPDDVRVAVCCPDPAARAAWDWVKWLPHARHPSGGGPDGTGLMVAEDAAGLLRLLSAELDRRRQRQRTVEHHRAERGPALVVVVDGALAAPDPLAELPELGVALLHVLDDPTRRPAGVDVTVHVDQARAAVEVRRGRDGAAPDDLVGLAATDRLVPDALGVAEVETLARRLAPCRLSRRAGQVALSEVSGLPDLLGVDDVAVLDPRRTWARRAEPDLLRVPLGVDADGVPVELDLKESALSGMGPHGLVVGATGSGKSELLRTLVTGLAATHPPDDLAFVLVDYKGGATFAGMADLPHVAGSITDLEDDPETVERFADALRSELRRREQLLRDAGNLTGIREHRRLRLAGGEERDRPRAMPHLLVVVDEFSELLTAQPDFIDLFVQIGRVGRSLGVHLLLATQRLEEGRLRGLDSHLSYRLALRTFSAAESRTVIGNTDAFELPPVPGSAYLKVDTSVYRRLRVATVSAPYTEPVRGRVTHPRSRPFRAFDGRGELADELPALGPALSDPEQRSTLDVVVARLRAVAPPVHQVWLAPLPPALPLTAVLARPSVVPGQGLLTARPGTLALPLGVVDRPDRQAQEPLVVDLSGTGGHLGLVGAPRTGKSTALRALVTAAALTHTPDELTVYAIDLGGGALASLEAWPHVGGLAGRHRPDTVRRLVAQLEGLVAQRERATTAPAGAPSTAISTIADDGGYGRDVLLVVDDWGALRGEFEDLEPRLTALAARGLGHGVHLVISAARWWDLRPALRDALGTRIELRLGDSADSLIDRRAARSVPTTPGRALVGAGFKAQIALPVITDEDGRTEDSTTTAARATAAWGTAGAPPIRMLPALVPAAGLLPVPDGGGGPAETGRGVPIGVREQDLAPLELDLLAGRDPHLLVFGEAGSGRTATLRTVVTALCAAYPPEQLRVVVVDYRRTLLDAVPAEHLSTYLGSAPAAERTLALAAEKMTERLPGPEVTPAQLRARSWWDGPHMLVVVDDHDLVATGSSDPLSPLLDLLAQGRDIGLHVVLARSASGAGSGLMQPVLRRLRELGGPGLLLSGPRDEGALLHGVRGKNLPAGRAQYVTRRTEPELVQIAWVPEADG
ncbi:type VII secretion protein EccCa [Actinomycetospora endophytica]|uniref:Type VII secretion protein EccCa n=1 Tax=Actinomycetospora endophytica TaxID=2291215 RepID=A0ABS8P1Y5_9PSEU|nr:type VII secretion protein EccCa [Actinomycetospora endophytica]MCD2192257.1 type VII secretion protein EccCa [Actinomycetospora endophytica]